MTRTAVFTLLLAVLALAPSASAVAPPTDRYVVVLEDSAESKTVARDHARAHGARVHHVYGAAIEGYAATIPAGRLAALRRDPRVKYVEEDGIVRASDVQANPTWGLDRIDQRLLPLSKSYTYSDTGAGVTAYVIDTGIKTDHAEFAGRATRSSSADFVSPSTAGDDCDGHGTHVAGTIGGTTYGVAKGVSLKAVRVLDCDGSGYYSWVIAGVDWVTSDHVAGAPAVANMSLGGGTSSSLDDAVRRSIADGVTYAIAAGNSGRDACNYSPARTAEALTIGASGSTDAKASFSNWGNCVDWFAPGVSITSAYITSTTATATWDGTSMAAPHVAGAAALYLEDAPSAPPLQVHTALSDALTKGIITSSSTTNNHLLYVAPEDGSPTNMAPSASFTYTCSGLGCSFDASGSRDTDGTIQSYSWDFGDSTSGSGVTTDHTYLAAGTYTVALTVTDDDGATATQSQQVVVTAPSSGGITLTATPRKVKGSKYADLVWSGAASTNVDVYRNGARITTTANDGAHTDTLRGGGTFTYKVCEAGTQTCSNSSTVTF